MTVLFAGQHIAKSPFEVQVGRAAGDAGRVSAQGPGIEPLGNVANKSTYFEIFTAGAPRGGVGGLWGGRGEAGGNCTPGGLGDRVGQGEREGRRPPGTGGGSKRGSPPHPLVTRLPPAGAGPGEVEVFITDPSGRRGTVEPTLEARGDGTYRCTYRPTAEGPHAVHVAFGGAPIPKSPFNVTVGQGEPRGAPLSPPPPRGVSGPPTPQAGGLSPSLAWGSLSSCPPSTWGSLSFPAWGPLSLQLGGLCLPLNSGSLPPPPPPAWGSLSPPDLGGVSVLPPC